MNTIKLTRFLPLFCFFFVIANVEGQKVLKRIKKKAEDKAVEMVDDELNGKGKKKKKKNEEEEGVEDIILGPGSSRVIDRNFIDRSNMIFHDDFDNEKLGEFPRKWTPVNGTVETGQFSVNNVNEGVVQMISTYSSIKPTFDKDDYLGDSFKIEFEHFFWQKGNEQYVVQLYGDKSSSPARSISIRSTNVSSGTDGVIYMAGKQSPGWYTTQISFNQGNLKVKVNGQTLINNPDINIRELTHASLKVLSPGSSRGDGYTKARVNYFMIAKEGLPLYDRLVTNGRIVVRDIYFDVNKYEIKPNSNTALDKIVVMLKEHKDTEVTIEGHTDANGTEESNQILSENRAEAVKKYLIKNGIARHRVSTRGYGERKLIDPNKDEQNRRVEFVMVKQ